MHVASCQLDYTYLVIGQNIQFQWKLMFIPLVRVNCFKKRYGLFTYDKNRLEIISDKCFCTTVNYNFFILI